MNNFHTSYTRSGHRLAGLRYTLVILLTVAISACGQPDVGSVAQQATLAPETPVVSTSSATAIGVAATNTVVPATDTTIPASATTSVIQTITPSAVEVAAPATATMIFLPTVVVSQTTTAAINGSVVIEGGRCCAGGTAGKTIQLSVAFAASSQAGPVTEMRTGRVVGCQNGDLSNAPWEPFVATKTYTTVLAINWVGWYIGAQYRDAQNNLSPVYCDDISLEGMPAPP